MCVLRTVLCTSTVLVKPVIYTVNRYKDKRLGVTHMSVWKLIPSSSFACYVTHPANKLHLTTTLHSGSRRNLSTRSYFPFIVSSTLFCTYLQIPTNLHVVRRHDESGTNQHTANLFAEGRKEGRKEGIIIIMTCKKCAQLK